MGAPWYLYLQRPPYKATLEEWNIWPLVRVAIYRGNTVLSMPFLLLQELQTNLFKSYFVSLGNLLK